LKLLISDLPFRVIRTSFSQSRLKYLGKSTQTSRGKSRQLTKGENEGNFLSCMGKEKKEKSFVISSFISEKVETKFISEKDIILSVN